MKEKPRLYNRVVLFLDKVPEKEFVILAMLVSIVFWSSISGYLKIQRIHADEWIYLQKAYALKNGYGLNSIYGIQGLGAIADRYIYSLLIAPACFIKDIKLRFKIIALINAVSLSSAAVPAYLMAKEMLGKRHYRLLVVIIALTMPYMNYCACFMSENVLIPLALWLVYLNYMLIRFSDFSLKKNIQRTIVTLILVILVWFTKRSARVFLYMEFVTIVLAFLYHNRQKIETHFFRVNCIIICLMLGGVSFFCWLSTYYDTDVTLQYIKGLFDISDYTNLLYWNATMYIIVSLILAFCIIPIVYSAISIRELNTAEKYFGFWLFIIISLLLALVIKTSYGRYYNTYPGFYEGLTQVWFRYILFLYVPFIILFFKTAEKNTDHSIIQVVTLGILLLFFWFLIVFIYRGAQLENAATYVLLYWVRNIGDIHVVKPLFSIVIAVIIGLFFYVYARRANRIVLLFVAAWFPIQLLNNVMCHSTFVSENSLKETSMLELRDFVLEHMEDTFLLVDMDDGHINSPNLWRGDAYLDTKNIIRYKPSLLFGASFPCDLDQYYKEYEPEVDSSKVKYVILTSTLEPTYTDDIYDLKIGNGCWYRIYELDEIGDLPTVQLMVE